MTPDAKTAAQLLKEANQLPPDGLARLGLMMFPEIAPPATHAEALVMECACRFIAFMTGHRPEVPK